MNVIGIHSYRILNADNNEKVTRRRFLKDLPFAMKVKSIDHTSDEDAMNLPRKKT
jgi:hypothetical protein